MTDDPLAGASAVARAVDAAGANDAVDSAIERPFLRPAYGGPAAYAIRS
jgi:hypothetical protein